MIVILIIQLISGIWALPTTAISTESLLPMKNVVRGKIEEFQKAFPKSPEIVMLEFLEKQDDLNAFINQLTTLNLTTFDEFMLELKKQHPSTYEVMKKMENRFMETYNSMENGKGKEFVQASYVLAWESTKALLLMKNVETVNLWKQFEILARLQALGHSIKRLMKEVTDSEWDSLVELFPFTVAGGKDNLPERIQKRLSDIGIIEMTKLNV
ncbi:unnamed protein product, partial [Mesorhabditis belari]|uniref:Uncharacterized protein n=1 Tax=Mesorhabditis belari TaxID=2138241 RepID=A0AAF3J4N9_9BILA